VIQRSRTQVVRSQKLHTRSRQAQTFHLGSRHFGEWPLEARRGGGSSVRDFARCTSVWVSALVGARVKMPAQGRDQHQCASTARKFPVKCDGTAIRRPCRAGDQRIERAALDELYGNYRTHSAQRARFSIYREQMTRPDSRWPVVEDGRPYHPQDRESFGGFFHTRVARGRRRHCSPICIG
jgi:hypothetical protein